MAIRITAVYRVSVLIFGVSVLSTASLGEETATASIVEALETSTSVLFVGAHADDENSSSGFLARSVGAGKATSLICFTRGENEPMDVGKKKGKQMGDARTEWLEDAANALGLKTLVQLPYTNGPLTVEELERGEIRYWKRDTTPEEVVAQWRKIGRDPYEDMVRFVRKIRPDLIVTWEKTKGWTGNAEHKTVGWLAERAFAEAGDPAVFPSQISEEGLEPWNPKFLFWVLSGEKDKVGPHPVNIIPCDAPGAHGMMACETKLMVGLTYAENWGREITEAQKLVMLEDFKQKKEYFQLAQYR